MKQINKAIQKVTLELERQQDITNRLSAIRKTLKNLNHNISRHTLVLRKELEDVQQLESMNVRSLFTKFIGDLESRLDKERQEYLHAFLRHKSMLEEQKLLIYEQKILRKKQVQKSELDNQLKLLLKQKSDRLKKTSSVYYKQLIDIDKRIAIRNTLLYKCKTAAKIGAKAKTILDKIIRDLHQTTEWNAVHEFHGKGRYSSMRKKTYIDKARVNVTKAKVLIDSYETHVERIFHDIDVQLSLESFDSFVDDFLDYLITDWVIQRKIKNALQCLDQNIDKVTRHNYALEHEMKKLEDQIKDLNQDKLALLDLF